MNKKKRNTRKRQIKRTIRGGQMDELTMVKEDIKNIKGVLNNLMATMVISKLIDNQQKNYLGKLLNGN
tara:strand:- start:1162 stop:1365 length:204 start_codon:yes stop_codon:yes gene_type:complete